MPTIMEWAGFANSSDIDMAPRAKQTSCSFCAVHQNQPNSQVACMISPYMLQRLELIGTSFLLVEMNDSMYS